MAPQTRSKTKRLASTKLKKRKRPAKRLTKPRKMRSTRPRQLPQPGPWRPIPGKPSFCGSLGRLPMELLHEVFDYVDSRSLYHLRFTSRFWNAIVSESRPNFGLLDKLPQETLRRVLGLLDLNSAFSFALVSGRCNFLVTSLERYRDLQALVQMSSRIGENYKRTATLHTLDAAVGIFNNDRCITCRTIDGEWADVKYCTRYCAECCSRIIYGGSGAWASDTFPAARFQASYRNLSVAGLHQRMPQVQLTRFIVSDASEPDYGLTPR